MQILNKEELDSWLFEHAQVQGHICDAVKGALQAAEPGDTQELVNMAYIDRETGEQFDVIYGA